MEDETFDILSPDVIIEKIMVDMEVDNVLKLCSSNRKFKQLTDTKIEFGKCCWQEIILSLSN